MYGHNVQLPPELFQYKASRAIMKLGGKSSVKARPMDALRSIPGERGPSRASLRRTEAHESLVPAYVPALYNTRANRRVSSGIESLRARPPLRENLGITSAP